MAGHLPERYRKAGHEQPGQRRPDQDPALRGRADPQCQPTDQGAAEGPGEAYQQGPAELGNAGPVEGWQAGDGERERAEATPMAKAGEDKRAGACREQAR